MKDDLYGLMAEFRKPENLLAAAEVVHKAGHRKTDAFSPFPIDGLASVLGHKSNPIGWISLFSGLIGTIVAYLLQLYSVAIAYPVDIGGRPLNSWPAFLPICFELTVLFAATGAVLSMFILNKLPEPYHPVFNSEEFTLMTKDRFFLLVEKKDPLFDLKKTHELLLSLNPERVIEVME
jgi:hypothetical protein